MTKPAYRGAWRTVRLTILERDGYHCQLRLPGCTYKATTVDHIVEVVRGGRRLDPTNLRAACMHCNSKRGGHTKWNTQPTTLGPSRQW